MTGRHAKPIGAILFEPGWDINKTEPVLSAFRQSNHAKIDEEVDYSNEQKCFRYGLTLAFSGRKRAILLDILIVFSLILDYQRMGQLKRCLQESFSPSHYGMAM